MASLQPAHDASQSWTDTRPNEPFVMEEQEEWGEGEVTRSTFSIQEGDDSNQSGRSYDHSIAASMTASQVPAKPQSWKSRFHVAFREDIPHPLRGLMFAVFIFLNTHVLLQFLSLVACGLAYGGTPFSGVVVANFFIFLLLSLCAYVFWYRPLYTAFRCRSTFHFVCFLFVFFGQLLVYLQQFVGGTPTSQGLVVVLTMSTANPGVFFFFWALTVLTMAQEVAGIVLWFVVICFWNSPRRNPRRM